MVASHVPVVMRVTVARVSVPVSLRSRETMTPLYCGKYFASVDTTPSLQWTAYGGTPSWMRTTGYAVEPMVHSSASRKKAYGCLSIVIAFDWRSTAGQAESRKLSMETEPVAVRVIDLSLVLNHWPSVQRPLNGGVPVKVAVMVLPGHEPVAVSVTDGEKTSTRAVLVLVPVHSESRKLRIVYVPGSWNACVSVVEEVWNDDPSDHMPLNGGVPVNVALIVAVLQLCPSTDSANVGAEVAHTARWVIATSLSAAT